MNQGQRVNADLENVKARDANKATRVDEIPKASIDDEPDASVKDEYAVTEEDLEALGPADLSMDGGEDEALKHRTRPVDFAAKDLDIPGSEWMTRLKVSAAKTKKTTTTASAGTATTTWKKTLRSLLSGTQIRLHLKITRQRIDQPVSQKSCVGVQILLP